MRWLDGTTGSMDVGLCEFPETVKERRAWRAAGTGSRRQRLLRTQGQRSHTHARTRVGSLDWRLPGCCLPPGCRALAVRLCTRHRAALGSALDCRPLSLQLGSCALEAEGRRATLWGQGLRVGSTATELCQLDLRGPSRSLATGASRARPSPSPPRPASPREDPRRAAEGPTGSTAWGPPRWGDCV